MPEAFDSKDHFFQYFNDKFNKCLSHEEQKELIEDLIVFSFGEHTPSDQFLAIIDRVLPLLLQCYSDCDGNLFQRKVNQKLYLRHILRAGALADQYFEELVSQNILVKDEYERLILSVLFHDAKEMRSDLFSDDQIIRKRLKELGSSEEKINQLLADINESTPKTKPQNISYFERKRLDFDPLVENYNNGNRVPLIAKAFDILANMEETIDDLRNGKEDGQLRPLLERYQVFAYRVDQLTEIFGNTQLTAYLRDCLNNSSPYVSGLAVFLRDY